MAVGDLRGTFTATASSILAANPLPAVAGSIAVSVGDLVFVVVGQQTIVTATTVTDNLGNTYTAQNAGSDAGNATGRSYYSIVTVAGTLTQLTCNAAGSTSDFAAVAAVIAGPLSVIDANPANLTNDLTSPFTCPATGTLAQASEVVIGWIASNGNATWSATSPNLLADQVIQSTTIKVIIGYQLVSATSSVAPEFTGVAPTNASVLGTASFKAVATRSPAPFSAPRKFFTRRYA
jgi:hypothetical protein